MFRPASSGGRGRREGFDWFQILYLSSNIGMVAPEPEHGRTALVSPCRKKQPAVRLRKVHVVCLFEIRIRIHHGQPLNTDQRFRALLLGVIAQDPGKDALVTATAMGRVACVLED